MPDVGARVRIVDQGDSRRGEEGVVVRGEYPSLLTGRLMVDVHLDGTAAAEVEAWYLDQVDEVGGGGCCQDAGDCMCEEAA